MQNRLPAPRKAAAFTPVPRRYRHDGWTVERQRAFIAALADTGSVRAAASRINMSSEGAYNLRRQPGAESFAQAWADALDHGVQNLVDIALDRARDGVPVPVFWKGEQVGERRWYNDRLLMFLLKHHMPARYGGNIGAGTKSRETVEREAAENCPVCRERREAEEQAAANAPAEEEKANRWLDDLLLRYDKKVESERHHRLAGEIVAADYTLRQLTHIELILDMGGRSMALLDRWTQAESSSAFKPELWSSPISEHLDERRQAIWEAMAEPPRPALPHGDRHPPRHSLRGGETIEERHRMQRAVEAKIAALQREWEALGTEETWAAWRGDSSIMD